MVLAVAPHPKTLRGFRDVTQLLAPRENVLMAVSNVQCIDLLDKGPQTGLASTSHGQQVGPAADHNHAFTLLARHTSALGA